MNQTVTCPICGVKETVMAGEDPNVPCDTCYARGGILTPVVELQPMQRRDDITGKPMPPIEMTPEWLLPQNQPLTAAQKERQREAMVQRLQELTAANNALYAQVTDALANTAEHEAALAAMQIRLAFLERHAMPLTFWGRLRWLVLGA